VCFSWKRSDWSRHKQPVVRAGRSGERRYRRAVVPTTVERFVNVVTVGTSPVPMTVTLTGIPDAYFVCLQALCGTPRTMGLFNTSPVLSGSWLSSLFRLAVCCRISMVLFLRRRGMHAAHVVVVGDAACSTANHLTTFTLCYPRVAPHSPCSLPCRYCVWVLTGPFFVVPRNFIAFPPMSGQRHIGHTLQKCVSNSPLASSRIGQRCRTSTRRCQRRSSKINRERTSVRFGVAAVLPGAEKLPTKPPLATSWPWGRRVLRSD